MAPSFFYSLAASSAPARAYQDAYAGLCTSVYANAKIDATLGGQATLRAAAEANGNCVPGFRVEHRDLDLVPPPPAPRSAVYDPPAPPARFASSEWAARRSRGFADRFEAFARETFTGKFS